MQHQNRSPENIRIGNRHSKNIAIWDSEEWEWKRIVFLSGPWSLGGCIWCGNIAHVVEHPNYEFYGKPEYLDFIKAGCVPMCVPCNQAKRRGKVLCPRCRQRGHYVNSSDEVCWSCKPAEERERLILGKEHRQRERNEILRKKSRKYRPVKVINKQTGKWVTISRK